VKQAGNRQETGNQCRQFQTDSRMVITTQKICRETDYRIRPIEVLSRPLREKKRDKASTIFGNHA